MRYFFHLPYSPIVEVEREKQSLLMWAKKAEIDLKKFDDKPAVLSYYKNVAESITSFEALLKVNADENELPIEEQIDKMLPTYIERLENCLNL